MNIEPKPCAGDCGKLLRPKRTTKDQVPGTVREEARGRCQPCYAHLEALGVTPKKLRDNQCRRCHRPTRPRGTRIEDNPGTVAEYSQGRCMTCWKHEKYGPPKGHDREHKDWSDCTVCERPMRPHNTTKSEAPGTVKHHARGVCTTCHRRALNPDRRPARMTVAVTPAVPVEAAVEPVEVAPEPTDPGVLLMLQRRRERVARQERAQRIRAQQEAVQRRFIASRRAAA